MGIAIPIAFLLLITILLWLNIGSKGRFFIKAAAIVITGFYTVAVWDSLGSLAGWPTDQMPPDEFMIYWAIVVEPDKRLGEEGGIYLWLTSLERDTSNPMNYKPASNEPRAYKLPYSLGLHKKIAGVIKGLMEGKLIAGKFGRFLSGAGGDGEGGDGVPGDSNQSQVFEFYQLPPPKPSMKFN